MLAHTHCCSCTDTDTDTDTHTHTHSYLGLVEGEQEVRGAGQDASGAVDEVISGLHRVRVGLQHLSGLHQLRARVLHPEDTHSSLTITYTSGNRATGHWNGFHM